MRRLLKIAEAFLQIHLSAASIVFTCCAPRVFVCNGLLSGEHLVDAEHAECCSYDNTEDGRQLSKATFDLITIFVT